MKIVEEHYQAFQAMAFSDREKWRWYARPVWWYLIVFVWLHQGIVHKNWENVFTVIGEEIQDKHKEYQQRKNLDRIHEENPDIAELTKLAGIKHKE
jgi:hypothetical protein